MEGAICFCGSRQTLHNRDEPFGKIRNRAAQMSQHPLDVRKTFSHAAEDEACRGKRCVHEKADERHEPIVEHGFNTNRICWMNMNYSAEFVRGFPKRPETSVAKRDAVDVAENHYAGKLKLLHGAAQFGNRRRRIAKRQRGKRSEQSMLLGNDAGKSVIHKSCKPDSRCCALYVRAGRGKSNDLSVNAGISENLYTIFNVAMAGYRHVVIARVMQAWISGRVMRNTNRARSLFNGLDVFRWIEMIMKVDRWHIFLKFRP